MDMQVKHIRLDADGAYPMLPENRAYAVVLITHEETIDFWRRGLAERMAEGACVQVNIWGENASEWTEAIATANAFAIMTEERSEMFPDITVSSQSNRMIEDVFEFSVANFQYNEAEQIDLLLVIEVGEPMFGYNLHGMANRAAREYGMSPALTC